MERNATGRWILVLRLGGLVAENVGPQMLAADAGKALDFKHAPDGQLAALDPMVDRRTGHTQGLGHCRLPPGPLNRFV
jgi:hypothetical protein